MSLVNRIRRQRAVYWKRVGSNEFGEPVFDYPIEIKVRWEDQAGEFQNARGEIIISKALVYVDRLMFVGDYLRKMLDGEDTIKDKHIILGYGTPEGAVKAPPKKLYWDLRGKAQYVKETGFGNTGWYFQFGGGFLDTNFTDEPAIPEEPEDPRGASGALEIQAFDAIPDLKNRPGRTLYRAHL
jgi:hypothetical protein